MLSIIDTQDLNDDYAMADVTGPTVTRLAAAEQDVYVATNPSGSAIYVGTLDEMVETFGDDQSNLVPLRKFEVFTPAHVPWKLSHN